jgi:hypothetical protein
LGQVQEGWVVGFQANVAHSAVEKFTLFYSSGERPAQEVLSSWVLGSGPCSSDQTTLEDRICVESTATASQFEPVHPWVGGDFNPFMGLDECPFLSPAQCQGYSGVSQTAEQGTPMCSCTCSPAWACGGSAFNYSSDFMLKEFPVLPACQIQSYTQVH